MKTNSSLSDIVARSEAVDIIEAIDGLTERVHAYRFVRLIESGGLRVDRLTEKLLLAAQVVPDQTKLLEADADKLIARGNEFSSRRTKTFAAHHAVLDSGDKGMDALDAQLALVTNDPLPSSGGSQEEDMQIQVHEQLNPLDLLNPNQPPAAAQVLPINAGQMTRSVPSRRDL
jgi:hypothetical protein